MHSFFQGEVAEYLAQSRGLPSVECNTEFQSTWLDNAKAKFALGAKHAHKMVQARECHEYSCADIPSVPSIPMHVYTSAVCD